MIAESAAGIALPEPSHEGRMAVEQALCKRRSVRDFGAGPLTLAEVSQLLWAAQGITDREGYRSAPSAGALYPLEIYLAVGNVESLKPGVYKYDPRRHQLRPLAEGDRRRELGAAAVGQSWLAEAAAVLVIAGVYARTAAKYGDRGQRYVLMEVGHAAQNVCLQAVALDLGTTVVGAFRDAKVKELVGTASGEEPISLIPVGRPL